MKVYAVNILDISENMLDRLCSLVDLEKRIKIRKLINKKDKIRTLIGEILIRTLISEELGISNNSITFEKNEYGKPYLKGYEKFNFNISHSEDYVVCAVDDNTLGIDIEKIKYTDYEGISKRFFTLTEYEYIAKNDANIGLNNFYEIWTLKESYIKCCGKGLRIPLNSFSIDIGKSGEIGVIISNKHSEYILKRFNIGSDYKMAICSLCKEIPDNIIMIDQNSLIALFEKE